MKLWDLSSLPQQQTAPPPAAVVTLNGHPDAVYDLAATPLEPHLLASCGRKGALILWDIRAQGKLLQAKTAIHLQRLEVYLV